MVEASTIESSLCVARLQSYAFAIPFEYVGGFGELIDFAGTTAALDLEDFFGLLHVRGEQERKVILLNGEWAGRAIIAGPIVEIMSGVAEVYRLPPFLQAASDRSPIGGLVWIRSYPCIFALNLRVLMSRGGAL